MRPPQLILHDPNSSLENRVYNVQLSNNRRIKVHVWQDIIEKVENNKQIFQEVLQVNCPELKFMKTYHINVNTYYPHMTLEQKMERATIEYGGTIDDMYSCGC